MGWGETLIEALLPTTQALLNVLDDRIDILFLGVEHNRQDSVVRVNIATFLVLGGEVLTLHPKGWLEVTTTLGAMLQPLVIAPAIAAAIPGRIAARLTRFGIAALFALGFLVVDLPITLYAYVWDMLIHSMGSGGFSPLLAWHEFLHAGGRLGLLAWRIERRVNGSVIG